MLTALNTWIGAKLKTTTKTVLAIEIGLLIGAGFTMMQIGEHFLAVMLWVFLAIIWVSTIFQEELPKSHRGLVIFERVFHMVAAIFVCTFLITITAIHRGEEPWTNLGSVNTIGMAATGASFSEF